LPSKPPCRIFAMALLTTDTVPGYVAKHLDKIDVISAGSTMTATEIEGGNLNYAFCVTDEKGNAVFVKQAPDFIKCFGPEAKLHRERLKLEVEVYNEWTSTLGDEVAVRFLPRIYHSDFDNMCFIMEFLGSYVLLDKRLYEGLSSEVTPRRMGEFMALAHAKTHSSLVGAERAETLTKTFENRKLRDIQLEYVFTKAFEAERSEWMRSDAAFMAELEEVRSIYNGKNKDNLALLHGDLHPGSVMVNDEGEAKVIDYEFGIYGPPGLDIGSFLSGYVLAYIFQAIADNGSVLATLHASIELFWTTYAEKARKTGLAEAIIDSIGEDAVAFTACEVARTALGFAGVRGLPIKDESVKLKVEEKAVRLAHRCLMGRKGKGMRLLLDELKNFPCGRDLVSAD